ncbi:MAG: sulfur relay protein DsrC [Proteobacteria bacterium]|nr:MAG: sulfur relay protein DsrC [Pseudomonadota bacterium]
MLWLSEILMKRHDLATFDELLDAVRTEARGGELFFRMDVKPPFPDTPANWEDRLESAFTELNEQR